MFCSHWNISSIVGVVFPPLVCDFIWFPTWKEKRAIEEELSISSENVYLLGMISFNYLRKIFHLGKRFIFSLVFPLLFLWHCFLLDFLMINFRISVWIIIIIIFIKRGHQKTYSKIILTYGMGWGSGSSSLPWFLLRFFRSFSWSATINNSEFLKNRNTFLEIISIV